MRTLTIDSEHVEAPMLEILRDPQGPNARLEQGLGVLQNLLGMIRLPQSADEERAALAVLLELATGDDWPAALAEQKSDLLSQLELLTASDVADHLQWFDERPASRITRALTRAHRGLGRRWSALEARVAFRFGSQGALRARARLLFVLLAMIAARVYRFTVLGALAREHIVGGQEQLDALLSWLRKRPTPPNEIELVREYLALVRDELYAQADHMRTFAEDLSAAEFATWPWTRQIVGLEYRRARWDRRHADAATAGPNPVQCAGEIEFRLARARAFGPLARRGGMVASASLQRMGYRDADMPRRRMPAGALLCAGLLMAAAAVMGAVSIRRLHAWDRQGAAVAAEVIGQVSYGETSSVAAEERR